MSQKFDSFTFMPLRNTNYQTIMDSPQLVFLSIKITSSLSTNDKMENFTFGVLTKKHVQRDRQTDRQTDRQRKTTRPTDGWKDGRTEGRTDKARCSQ